MEEFRITWVLRRALEVCWARLPVFTFIALLAQAPAVALFASQPHSPTGLPLDLQVLDQLLGELLVGAIAYGTIMHVRKRPASTGSIVNTVLVCMLPMLAIGVATGLPLFASRWLPLLIVPGIYFSVVFFLAVPIILVERPGVIASLRLSAQRTDGYRLQIFGLLAVLVGLALIINSALRSTFGGGAQATLYVGVGMEIVLGVLSAAVLGISYCSLRPKNSQT